ncbi:MAG TPA: uroporphyrinogen-III C-methyltransferase [Terriglobales bacterium]|nr:uroporphyrinogen-III C-methyltransferase [Terriglobales bacterium]
MTARRNGKVYLVGAGPGDPELLTRKAHRLLGEASVVLHDDLVSGEILALARPEALLVNVGKPHGEKRTTQSQINALLVFFATGGSDVLRLKGGDPLVFGRAGEEMDALDAAGVEYEIVPGVTAAFAAAASVRRSLTDRRAAATLIVTTANRCAGEATDWHGLARSDATLAIYMPGRDYGRVADELIAAGLERGTPCIIVSRAATREQQTATQTLAELGKVDPLPTPALLLVGKALAKRAEHPAEHPAATGPDVPHAVLPHERETCIESLL